MHWEVCGDCCHRVSFLLRGADQVELVGATVESVTSNYFTTNGYEIQEKTRGNVSKQA